MLESVHSGKRWKVGWGGKWILLIWLSLGACQVMFRRGHERECSDSEQLRRKQVKIHLRIHDIGQIPLKTAPQQQSHMANKFQVSSLASVQLLRNLILPLPSCYLFIQQKCFYLKGRATEWKLYPDIPQGWQGPKNLDHLPLPPQAH